jgi:hypothetical protein
MHTTQVSISELSLIKGYNNEQRVPTWVIHTPSDSTFGGFSAEFVHFEDFETVLLKKANGDTYTAPLSQISIRVQY